MIERTSLLSGFQLGEWHVRPDDGSLTGPAGTVRLEPLLMDLLVCLCARAGEVVTKAQLLEDVWHGRYVSDETIKGSLYQIRKALGDNSKAPRFVETLPKRGYRMVARPVVGTAHIPAGSPSRDADERYRKGQAALSDGAHAAALKQARLYFERALESDPDHAAALAALARTFVLMISAGAGETGELLQRIERTASRARELNPLLADAALGSAVVAFARDDDADIARRDFQQAIALAPEDMLTRLWHARFLASQQEYDAAIVEARRALAVDPLSLVARRELLEVLFLARRSSDMEAEAQRLLDLAPNSADVQLGLVWVHALKGEDRQASVAFVAGLTSLGMPSTLIDQAKDVYKHHGVQGILRLWAGVLEKELTLASRSRRDLVALYALLGDADRCFAMIETVRIEGGLHLLWLPVSPLFDTLRADLRYDQLISKRPPPFPDQ